GGRRLAKEKMRQPPVPAKGFDPYSDQRVTYATRKSPANVVAASIVLRCRIMSPRQRMKYQPSSRLAPLRTMQLVLSKVSVSCDIDGVASLWSPVAGLWSLVQYSKRNSRNSSRDEEVPTRDQEPETRDESGGLISPASHHKNAAFIGGGGSDAGSRHARRHGRRGATIRGAGHAAARSTGPYPPGARGPRGSFGGRDHP